MKTKGFLVFLTCFVVAACVGVTSMVSTAQAQENRTTGLSFPLFENLLNHVMPLGSADESEQSVSLEGVSDSEIRDIQVASGQDVLPIDAATFTLGADAITCPTQLTEDALNYTAYTALAETPSSDWDLLFRPANLSPATRAAIDAASSDRPATPEATNQEPVYGDNTYIETIRIKWLSRSDVDRGIKAENRAGEDTLVLLPDGDKVTNQQFQIDFSLSGENTYAPGTIQITIPAYIWLDRNNKEPGELTLAVPEDPDLGAEFVWTRKGDTIVITNNKELTAACAVTIQGTFRNVTAHQMIDMTQSRDLYATINVQTPNNNELLTMVSNSIDATINTYAEVTEASKTAWNTSSRKYDVWWNEVPSSIPETLKPGNLDFLSEGNPEDYVYVRWYVSATARGNQPYTLSLTDEIFKVDGEPQYQGVVLGGTSGYAGIVPSKDGSSVTVALYEGYSESVKSGYIWTAYPKSAFEGMESGTEIIFDNKQTSTVHPVDNIDPDLSMWAPAQVKTHVPILYTFVKVWDDEGNAAGHRPEKLGLRIYYDGVSWKYVYLTEKNTIDSDHPEEWVYQWSDDGAIGGYRVKEELLNASGVIEEKFDDSGHREEWSYVLKSSKYDEDTHTWTYVNEYDEGWIKFEVSTLDKQVEYKYRDSSLTGDRDGLALNKLARGEEVEVQYDVVSSISVAEPSVWYGAKPFDFVLEDVRYILNNNENLTTKDVDVGAVILKQPVAYRYSAHHDEQGWHDRNQIEAPVTTLYGLKDGQWIAYATIQDNVVRAVEESVGVTVSGDRVNLPAGVERVKTVLTSDDEHNATIVEMAYTVALRVYPTDRVKAMIAEDFELNDYLRYPIYNKANAYAIYRGHETIDRDYGIDNEDGSSSRHGHYEPGDRVVDLEAADTGFMHGREFKVAVDLAKDFKLTATDQSKSRVQLHSVLKLTQQSNVVSLSNYNQALLNNEIPNTESGTYYDLLPLGVYVDLDSVAVTAGGSVADAWVIPNYRDSGRQLLVVKVNQSDNISYTSKTQKRYPQVSYPSEGYKNQHTLEFDAYCSFDTIIDEGLDYMRNVAAYEADEGGIGNMKDWSGEPDDPNGRANLLSANAVGNDADLMTNLDATRNDPAFVYAGKYLDYDEIDTYAIADIQKHVQATGSGYWSDGYTLNDVNVEEGGTYTYRLYMRSASSSTTKDIIILDSIENYKPYGEDRDAGDNQWKGTLLSVDVSQLEELGIKPVVYYNTTEAGLDISALNPEPSDTRVAKMLEAHQMGWTDSKPDDMSKVTAIAVDARYKEDGSAFELDSEHYLAIYLHMLAPYDTQSDWPSYFYDTTGHSTDGTDHTVNAHAYNNVYLDCVSTYVNGETHRYVHYEYTKVGIYTKSLEVQKVWDDDDDRDGLRPDGVQVDLFANGKSTGQSADLNEVNGWRATFKRLRTYDDDGNYIQYSFREKGANIDAYTATVTKTADSNGVAYFTITNTHDPEKTSVSVTKRWTDDNDNINGTRPDSIRVKLLADGEDTGTVLTLRPDTSGKWVGEFTELNKYRDGGIPIEYTIVEIPSDDNADYVPSYEIIQGDSGQIQIVATNNYHPYSDLTVKKLLQDATPEAANNEFTFTLLLKDAEGSPVTDEFEYEVFNADNASMRVGTIQNGDEFKLKGNERIVITHIPTRVIYTVTEASLPGFTLTDVVGAEGTISNTNENYVEFTNTYESTGRASLTAHKKLSGKTLSRLFFKFELLDENKQIVSTAYNDVEGNIGFSALRYTQKDSGKTYTYYLHETDGGKSGYTYDSKLYKVEVTPHDNGDGTMTCAVVYYGGDGSRLDAESDGPTFSNVYDASGDVQLKAYKSLINRDLKDKEFTFVLFDENFKEISRAQNDSDGNVVFEKIHYNTEDIGKTFFYFAHEERGKDPDIVYDNRILVYKVTVKDNNDGTLSFDSMSFDGSEVFTECEECGGTGTVSREEEGRGCEASGCHFGFVLDSDYGVKMPSESAAPEFKNKLKPGSLTVTKAVTGNGADPNQEFNFRVKISGKDLEGFDLEYEVSQQDNEPDDSQVYGISIGTISDGNLDNAREEVESHSANAPGTNGITWTLYDDSEMVIRPTDYVSGVMRGLNFYGDITSQGRYPLWKSLASQTKKVTFQSGVTINPWDPANQVASNLFRGFEYMEEIDFSDVVMKTWDEDPSRRIGLPSLLEGCSNLKKVNFNNSDFSSVSSINNAFGGCNNLEEINFGEQFKFPKNTSFKFFRTTNTNNEDDFNASKSWIKKEDLASGDFSFFSLNEIQDEIQIRDNNDFRGTWVRPSLYSIVFEAGNGISGTMSSVAYIDAMSDYDLPRNQFVKRNAYFSHWRVKDTKKIFEIVDGKATIPANTFSRGDTVVLEPVFEEKAIVAQHGRFDFTLHGNEQITFENIPGGTTYEVWEEAADGWVLRKVHGESGTIKPNDNVEADFLNEYNIDRAQAILVGEKLLDDVPASSAEAFTFELVELSSDSNQGGQTEVSETQRAKVGESGLVQFVLNYTEDDIGTHKYQLRELAGDDPTINYDPTVFNVNVTVERDDAGVLICRVDYLDDDPHIGFIFRNYTKPGYLAIAKEVQYADEYAPNLEQEFTFEVKLFDADGVPLQEGEFDWYVVERNNADSQIQLILNGTTLLEKRTSQVSAGFITVALHADQMVVIPGLAAGTSYEIQEIDLPAGWSLDSSKESDGAAGGNSMFGIIGPNEGSKVTLTNTYHATGYTVLSAYKTLENGVLSSSQFMFELYDQDPSSEPKPDPIQIAYNGAPDSERYLPTDDYQENPLYGYAKVAFDPISFDKPGAYTYYIREVVGADPTISYDDRTVKVLVTVEDDGAGNLTSQVRYQNAEDVGPVDIREQGAVFVNHMKPGSLSISKTLQNATAATAEQDFVFRVTFYDRNGDLAEDTGYSWYVVDTDWAQSYLTGNAMMDDLEGQASKSATSQEGTVAITLKANQTALFLDLPAQYQYTVEEVEVSDGFTLLSSSGTNGTIVAGGNREVHFVNQYQAEGSIQLSAQKIFRGALDVSELEESDALAAQSASVDLSRFEFTLTDQNDRGADQVQPAVFKQSEKSSNADKLDAYGIVSFDPIYFTQDDDGKEFRYIIEEVQKGNDPSVIYDDHAQTVTVRVVDKGDGTMSVVRVGDDGEIDLSESFDGVFTNVANNGALEISKTVAGSEGDTAQKFNFVVTLYSDEGMQEVATSVTGTFEGLEFRNGVAEFTLCHGESVRANGLPAGLYYQVKEKESDQGGYSTTVKNATGKITQDQMARAEFVNRKDMTGTLALTKTVQWTGNHTGIAPRSFTFLVSTEEEAVAGKSYDVYTSTGDLEGSLIFSNDGAPYQASIAVREDETLTIKGLPEITFTVSEDLESAYTKGYTVEAAASPTDTVTIDRENNAEVTITNTYTYAPGDLKIEKTLTGNGLANPWFEVRVLILADDGAVDESFNGTYGETVFANGVATVFVADGRPVTISGLPSDLQYHVEEVQANQNGYTTTYSPADGSGTIVKDETQNVTITNTRHTGSLALSKGLEVTLDGTHSDALTALDQANGTEFTFEIKFDGAGVEGRYAYWVTNGKTNGETAKRILELDENKKGQITLKAGQMAIIDDIAEGVTYKITESDAQGYVAKAEGFEDGKGASGAVAGDQRSTVKFTNSRNVESASLKITKSVENALLTENAKDFTFTVELGGVNSDEAIALVKSCVALTEEGAMFSGFNPVDDKPGTYEASFTLKDAQSLTITGLPQGVTYTVSEADYRASGFVTSVDGQPTNFASGTLALSDARNQWPIAMTFTNKKNVVDASAVLKGTKKLTDARGSDPQEAPIAEAAYSFVVTPDPTNPADDPFMGESRTVSNDADGKINFFADMGYGEAGVYRYTISEVVASELGIAYDQTAYVATITVSVSDETGQLEAHAAIEKVEGDKHASVEDVIFTNEIRNVETKVQLEGAKTFIGGDLVADQFKFELVAVDNAPLAPQAADGKMVTSVLADGRFVFDEITYTTPGTYTYTLTEKKGTDWTIGYDPQVYTVTVNVSQVDSLTLQASVTYALDNGIQLDKALFTNVQYDLQPAVVNLGASKTLESEDPTIVLKDGQFSFNLKPVAAPEGADNPIPTTGRTVRNIGNAITVFDNTAFTAEGSYVYELSEIKTDLLGFTWDTTVYTITVNVTRDSVTPGKLNAEVVLTKLDDQSNAVITVAADRLEFVNHYTQPRAKATIQGDKTFVDGDLTFQSFDVHIVGEPGAPMPASDVATTDDVGHFNFGEIEYTEPGSYVYYVQEIVPDEADPTIVYDRNWYKVLVNVAQTGDNGLQASVIYSDDDSVRAVEIVNTKVKYTVATVDLKGHKSMTGQDATLQAGQFQFLLTPAEPAIPGDPLAEPQTLLNAEDGTITIFDSLPFTQAGTYVYRLMEQSTNRLLGWTYDDTTYEITVAVTDGRDGLEASIASITKTNEDGSSQTVTESLDSFVEFKNAYTKPAPIDMSISGTKILRDGVVQNEQFAFACDPILGTETMARAAQVTNGPDGEFQFDFSFDEPGQYFYRVYEIAGQDSLIDYDTSVYYVTITVAQDPADNLKLVASVDYELGAESKEALEFINIQYTQTPVRVDLEATKVLEGKSLAGGDFAFVMTPDEANGPDDPIHGIQTIRNDASGSIAVFNNVSYEAPGTYVYTLVEQAGTDAGYTYDDTVHTITVVVSMAADRKLFAQVLVDDNFHSPLVFRNTYEPAAVEVSLGGQKQFDRDLSGDDFAFQITAIDSAPLPDPSVVRNDASGHFSFGDITYSAPGTYVYQISETDRTDDTVVYDPRVFTVTVDVSDVGGRLEAQVSYAVEDEDQQGVTFTNTTRVIEKSEHGDLLVTKTVDISDVSESNAETAHQLAEAAYRFTITGDEEINGSFETSDPQQIVIFKDGQAQVEIRAGASLAIKNLPVGVYRVTEDIDGAARAGFMLEVIGEGLVALDGTVPAEVEVTNSYVDPLGSLTINKALEGVELPDKNFVFTIQATGDAIDAIASKTVVTNSGLAVPFDSEGKATLTITGAGSVTLEGIPNGTYIVTEDEDAGAEPGYTLKVIGNEVQVTINDTELDVTITNVYSEITEKPTGSLAVSKTVTGNLGDKETDFHFQVTLADETINGKYGDMLFEQGVATFTLRHGQIAVATGLPEDLAYAVVETEADEDGYSTSWDGLSDGSITSSETALVSFINDRDSKEPEKEEEEENFETPGVLDDDPEDPKPSDTSTPHPDEGEGSDDHTTPESPEIESPDDRRTEDVEPDSTEPVTDTDSGSTSTTTPSPDDGEKTSTNTPSVDEGKELPSPVSDGKEFVDNSTSGKILSDTGDRLLIVIMEGLAAGASLVAVAAVFFVRRNRRKRTSLK